VVIREECEVIALIIWHAYYIKILRLFIYLYNILVYYEKISHCIFVKGGSLCMRPYKESVMEKPEPTSKYEEEPVG